MITLQSEAFEIESEPGIVLVRLLDTATKISVCTCMTPGQALRFAAQIMAEADKAEDLELGEAVN